VKNRNKILLGYFIITGDLLAKQLVEYSNVEDISHSTKAGLHRWHVFF
jgi:hypothetical protein